MSENTVLIFLIVASISTATILSIAETSLTRMNKFKAAALVEQGRHNAAKLEKLVEHPERTLNPVLLLILICHLVAATLIGVVADDLFGALGILAATFVEIVVIFVLAEAAPKTWAVQHTERAALLVTPLVSLIVSFPPLRWLTRGLIGISNALLPGKGLKSPYVSEEELLAITDAALEEGEIEHEERALIHSIIEFGDTIVREVMVPRPDMATIKSDETLDGALRFAMKRGFSRLPVVGKDIDDIAGVAYIKDIFRAVNDGKGNEQIRHFVRSAHFVPETKAVGELMREMQSEKHHMAVVLDEYGGTAGLVTLEDLIEELVGEIVDEFDREEPTFKKLSNGDFLVNAKMAPDEIGELLEIELPQGDWDTVSGFIFDQLGRVPVQGDSIDFAGFTFLADRVQGRRITRIRVKPAPATEEAIESSS